MHLGGTIEAMRATTPRRAFAGSTGLSASVRRAGAADVAALTRLVNLAYQVEAAFTDGERTDEDEIAALLEDGELIVLDRASGDLAAAVHVRADGVRGRFAMLAVDPELQG